MTATERLRVAKQWEVFMRFLADGKHTKYNATANGTDFGIMAPKEFTNALYQHLHLHCGYIAHYSRHGFYDTYFTGVQQELHDFFRNFEKTEWGGYPSASTWGDHKVLGEVMCDTYAKYKDKIFANAYLVD